MRDVSVASSLAAEGAPVVPPIDLMPPDRLSHAALDVSFRQFVRQAPRPRRRRGGRLRVILWTPATAEVFPEFAGRAQAALEEWPDEHST
ncbi:hypothetical protein [Nonomuraea roseola]|uniref:hypothetical protein n=1 Tax=Nonomuraea roseola TaxID=46179 RepID=UPI0031F9473C